MVRGAPQGDRDTLGGSLQGLRASPLEIGLYDEVGGLEKALESIPYTTKWSIMISYKNRWHLALYFYDESQGL